MNFSNLAFLHTVISYTMTIGAGAQDLAGNSMASDYTWSFTTASRPPSGGKKVTVVKDGVTPPHTTAEGKVEATVTAKSADAKAAVRITAGTIAKIGNTPLTEVTVTPPSVLPAAPPANVNHVGYAYNFGPRTLLHVRAVRRGSGAYTNININTYTYTNCNTYAETTRLRSGIRKLFFSKRKVY